MAVNHPLIMEPIVEREIVDRVHVIPKPMDNPPVEIKEVHIRDAEMREEPFNIPQVHFISIEQVVDTFENPIEIP